MIEECKLKNGEKKEREIYYTKEMVPLRYLRFPVACLGISLVSALLMLID